MSQLGWVVFTLGIKFVTVYGDVRSVNILKIIVVTIL